MNRGPEMQLDDAAAADARRLYDRAARFYDLRVLPMELMGMRRLRRRLIGLVQGTRILEVGVGTGINLDLYPRSVRVNAIDLSPKMLECARQRVRHPNIELSEMSVQEMQFAEGTFDSVVSTCVFCSVPDPVQGLREVRRVLKPGGRALFLEHVRPGGRWLGPAFDRLDPIVSRFGPHINRPTVANIRAAGLRIVHEEDLLLDIVKLLVAEP